jgi:hypothetical protein
LSRTIRRNRNGDKVREKDARTYRTPPRNWRVNENRSARREDQVAVRDGTEVPRRDKDHGYHTW